MSENSKKIKYSSVLVDTIVDCALAKKAEKLVVLDVKDITSLSDYFIICSGNSNTQVNAISSAVQKTVSKELKDKPWHIEGQSNSEWILMDYVNVVVHIFQKHIREFYDIESLWGDAKITEINPV